MPQIYAAIFYIIYEFFVGVEALGSQPEFHLAEKIVSASRKVQTVTWVVENPWAEGLDYSMCAGRGLDRAFL